MRAEHGRLGGEPFTPTLSSKSELVLLVGYPSMGKSTLYRKHFGPAGYEHINQDVLGSKPKCIKATNEALSKGKSCVVGAKYPDDALGAVAHRTFIQTTRIETGKRGNSTSTLRKKLASRSGECDDGVCAGIEFCLRIPLVGRCFKFENSIDLAWHNNMYRTYCLAPSTLENEVSGHCVDPLNRLRHINRRNKG